MKKLIFGFALLLISVSAFAERALVISQDEGCAWNLEGNIAFGNVHFVLNDGDQWVLSCHGEAVTEPPDRALVLKSSDDDPQGLCFAGGLTTANFQTVFTPAGNSKFTCWGTIDE